MGKGHSVTQRWKNCRNYE